MPRVKATSEATTPKTVTEWKCADVHERVVTSASSRALFRWRWKFKLSVCSYRKVTRPYEELRDGTWYIRVSYVNAAGEEIPAE
jgi:hypothetical protein